MNSKESLVGKTITLFLDGGWQITGEVKSFEDNRFTVEQDGNLFMVFKEKVACLLLSESARTVPLAGASSSSERTSESRRGSPASDTFPMNSISYDESSMSIPGALLSNIPEEEDNDLSVFFAGGNALPSSDESEADIEPLNKTSINFKVSEDDTKD